jgi:lysozyme family protein
MATFEPAVEVVLDHEGGYVDDPADRGGRTKFGISQRSYPALDIAKLTRQDAIEIYRRDWWHRYGYERIRDQRLATKVFDLAVNMGARRSHLLLQQALKAVGLSVTEDGLLGPETFAAVNLAPAPPLLAALRSEAAGHYRLLMARTPTLQRFSRGWLGRAYP